MISEIQDKIHALLERYDTCSFYAVDPGALRALNPIYTQAITKNKQTKWYAAGWAEKTLDYPYSKVDEIGSLELQSDCKHGFFMGQQTDFSACYNTIQLALRVGFEIIFVSDHWKDITDSFFSAENPKMNALPHLLMVPDQYAYDILCSSFIQKGLDRTQIEGFLRVFLHPGLEDIIERIPKYDACEHLIEKYDCSLPPIFLPLDPFEPETLEIYGYDWQYVLEMAYEIQAKNYPHTKVLVKSHPRQDKFAVKSYIHNKFCGKNLAFIEEENPAPFLRICSEVWGMSSLLMIAALRLGKPVKCLMPNATDAGLKHCNPHLRPYLVTRLED